MWPGSRNTSADWPRVAEAGGHPNLDLKSSSAEPSGCFPQVHICCLAFREPSVAGGGGGTLKCLCELSANDEIFQQRAYLYGLYRLYMSDAAARAAQPVRAEAGVEAGVEAVPPTPGPGEGPSLDVPGAGLEAGAEEADGGDERGDTRTRRQARRQRSVEGAGLAAAATPQAVEAWLDERLLAGQADLLLWPYSLWLYLLWLYLLWLYLLWLYLLDRRTSCHQRPPRSPCKTCQAPLDVPWAVARAARTARAALWAARRAIGRTGAARHCYVWSAPSC